MPCGIRGEQKGLFMNAAFPLTPEKDKLADARGEDKRKARRKGEKRKGSRVRRACGGAFFRRGKANARPRIGA